MDDCWGVRNNETKEIEGDPERFPEGMPAFIAKIHAMGFQFGLYTDIGTAGCHAPFVGSWPDYQKDANTFASWNVDYVKFDGCDQPRVAMNASTLTCNMSHALNNTGRDMWLNFHCWHDEACAECGNSFRIYNDHHDVWASGGSSTTSVIKFLQNNRQDYWGADPTFGWPDPDFIYTGGQGCAPKGQHSAPGVRCPGQTETEYVSEYSIWAIAGGQMVLATDPRNMTAFMRGVLLNKEVIAVFKDVSGFRSIKVLDVSATVPAAPATAAAVVAAGACTVALKHQLSSATCTLGTSFGCYDGNNTMWTDHGCRGEFSCNADNLVSCDYTGPGRHNCECARPPPPSVSVWLRPLVGGGAAAVLFNPSEEDATITVDFGAVPDRSWGAATQLLVRDLWALHDNGTATGSFATAHPVPPHGSVFLTLTPVAQEGSL